MDLLLCAVYIALIGVLSHYVGEAMPRENVDPYSFPFKSFGFERDGRIYEKIGIKKWKDRLPDMSRVMTDMVPKKISSAGDIKAMKSVLVETCIAEKIHWCLIFMGFGCLLIKRSITVKVLVLLNVLGNLPFIIIQRYNRPRLAKTIACLEKRLVRS